MGRRLDDRQILGLFHREVLATPLVLSPTHRGSNRGSAVEHAVGNSCDPDERQFLAAQTPLV
jgi:hypothetical protein